MAEWRYLTLEEQKLLDRAWRFNAKVCQIIGWTNPAPDASPIRSPSDGATLSISPHRHIPEAERNQNDAA